MKKIKKAIIYGLVVTAVINGFGFLVAVINSSLDSTITDFKRIGPITISIFFIPAFLSIVFYKKHNLKKNFQGLKYAIFPALISFTLVYVVVYFSFLHTAKPVHPGFYRVALFNALLSVIIYVFSSLIIYLINTNTSSKTRTLNIHPSFIKVFTIFLFVTIVFNIILYGFGNSSWSSSSSILRIAISGLLIAFISFLSFSYAFREGKSNTWFVLIYIVNTLLMPVVIAFFGPDFSLDLFLTKFKVIFSIISPYYLMQTLAIHTYFIYLINKQEKQSLKQVGVEASLKYQQLKAQLSPHFLFNNISVLTGLIEEDQEKAVAFSEDLARVYRYFLDKETHDLVLLTEELAFSHRYLELLKVRFENALVLNNEVKETKDLYIIPMALQQVFENVVKHNALTTENPITISLSIHNNFLVVSNTLHPKLTRVNTNQTGLENLQDRYSYFTDEKVDVIKNQNLFIIKLPLLNPEAQ